MTEVTVTWIPDATERALDELAADLVELASEIEGRNRAVAARAQVYSFLSWDLCAMAGKLASMAARLKTEAES